MCVTPLKYFIDYVESTSSSTSESDILINLNNKLNNTFELIVTTPQSNGICKNCIGNFCSRDNGYILSSSANWISFRQDTTPLDYATDCQKHSLRCCLNFFGSLESMRTADFYDVTINNCCGDFKESDDYVFMVTGITSSMTLNNLGIFEYGGPYLRSLSSYFKNKSQTFRYNYTYTLLSKGLVVKFLEVASRGYPLSSFWFGSVNKYLSIC